MRLILLLILFPFLALADAGDIVFVGQVPFPQDFANLVSTFGNQSAALDRVPRGGDLFIRYADGTIKNLTKVAGLGVTGLQGENSIAVRDPSVHWSGTKVIFSMVIGGAKQRYEVKSYFWQLYEITGLGKNETPVVTKVPNQPTGFNNIMPAYGTDDRIIFSTDRPRKGEQHLYPQRDEYESTATNTGLWSLNPQNGDLVLLDHAPSGAFHPIVDSFGRVLYTRWDHLQRDQQNLQNNPYGAMNFQSEAQNAAATNSNSEVFPESRDETFRTSPFLNLHTFNQFFPWMIHEDGTEHETLNHIGRHELVTYFDRSFNDDSNLDEYLGSLALRANVNSTDSIHQLREDPQLPGRYFGIKCPEFGTHASGQIIAINGAPQINPRSMTVEFLTHPDTATTSNSVNHSGLYRNPLPLINGTIIASHTNATQADSNIGSGNAPKSRYDYRIKQLVTSGPFLQPGSVLTSGILVNQTWWSPDELLSYSGNLWELQPVELVARIRPAKLQSQLPPVETAVLAEEGASLSDLQNYLRQNNLALIVVRNVTTRDRADIQQPFNLRVAGTDTKTVGASGKIYDVSHLQIFQGDLIRGYNQNLSGTGRRVIAQPMHDAINPEGSPLGAVKVADDGSVAALVPAQRALTWELTNEALPAGQKGVVRERYWLTFQPGEVRVCGSCHGVNTEDQARKTAPENKPQALRDMLRFIKNLPPVAPTPTATPTDTPTDEPSPESPTFKLTVQGLTSRNRNSETTLTPGRAYAIQAQRLNQVTLIQPPTLKLLVEGKACSSPLRDISIPQSGKQIIKGKAPNVRRDTKLTFQLTYAGSVKTSKKMTLLNSERNASRRRAVLSSKELIQICRSFSLR
jgi:hypothetical protein